MVVNTSLRSINSASEHGNMAIYAKERIFISDVIQIRDKQLRKKITATDTHCLTDLLPKKRTYQSLRQRGHEYMLPRIRTERFKL